MVVVVLRSGDAIANPVTGERIVVRATARESGGERFEVERFLPPDHPRQTERIHPRQETQITVVRGVAGFKRDGRIRMALPGERLLAPAGARHQLWNAGGDTLHVRFEQRPGLESTERLLLALCTLAATGQTDSRGTPGLLQRSVMIPAYADTLRLTNPPWPVQRALCRLIGPLARARGHRPFPEDWSSVRVPSGRPGNNNKPAS
jgi:mannose-6-phosphate isomerase-like protein (cupin superfamily)